MDLLVTRNDFTPNPAKFTFNIMYEGKSSTGDTFDQVRTQLDGYGNSGLQTGQKVYMIGARGKSCIFWRYTKGSTTPDEWMSVNNRTGVQFSTRGSYTQYDIQLDQDPVTTMLNYIVDNPLT